MRTASEFKTALNEFINHHKNIWYILTLEDEDKDVFIRFNDFTFEIVGENNIYNSLLFTDLLIEPIEQEPLRPYKSYFFHLEVVGGLIDLFFMRFNNKIIGTTSYGETREYYVKDGQLYGINYPAHISINHIGRVDWECNSLPIDLGLYTLDEFMNYMS